MSRIVSSRIKAALSTTSSISASLGAFVWSAMKEFPSDIASAGWTTSPLNDSGEGAGRANAVRAIRLYWQTLGNGTGTFGQPTVAVSGERPIVLTTGDRLGKSWSGRRLTTDPQSASHFAP